MTLLTPILTAGNIVQIYAAFEFPERVSTDSGGISYFDIVQCSTQYHGTENFDFYLYEVHDYYSIAPFFDATDGTYATSIESNLDTANGGTEDWVLDETMSKNTCYQSYCEFTCVVSRAHSSLDSTNDTQFSLGQEISVMSGYTVWKDRAETATSSNNSKGLSSLKTVTLMELGAKMLAMTATMTAIGASVIF